MLCPVTIIGPTYCEDCGSDSIDIYNMYNKPIGYPAMVRNFGAEDVINLLNQEKYPLAYMKCSRCNKIYVIDWSRGIPRPLRDPSVIHSKFKGKVKSIKS